MGLKRMEFYMNSSARNYSSSASSDRGLSPNECVRKSPFPGNVRGWGCPGELLRMKRKEIIWRNGNDPNARLGSV